MRTHPVLRWAVPAFLVVQAGVLGLAWWADSGLLLALAEVAALTGFGCLLLLAQYLLLRGRYTREREAARRAAERRRVADEVHDLVGHELSLIAMQAGLLELRADGADAELAGQLRAQAERAVASLHDTVALLHGTAPDEPVTDDIEALVARARRAGARVTLHGNLDRYGDLDSDRALDRDAEPAAGPPAGRVAVPARLAVHAVVREGLTNAARHAPGSTVAVVLSTSVGADGDVVEARVATSGAPPPDAPGAAGPAAGPPAGRDGGHGLDALHRRVAALGGRLDVRHDDETHVLTARIPAQPVGDPLGSVEPVEVAGARPLRALVRQTAVPVVVACTAVLAFWTWASHDTTAEPEVLTRFAVGLPAGELDALVPERQAPVRLARSPEPPPGSTCRAYTDGNFPLAAASVEVCADGQAVTRVTDLAAEPLW
ncbi:sensor histidine kinase [Promicromonospora vindobonensis]|uniref:histidine kinase n=1 Tax=Promicromonospora vindobonensis TaxID=195748 RepID=A0ABW5VVI0_9MICO